MFNLLFLFRHSTLLYILLRINYRNSLAWLSNFKSTCSWMHSLLIHSRQWTLWVWIVLWYKHCSPPSLSLYSCIILVIIIWHNKHIIYNFHIKICIRGRINDAGAYIHTHSEHIWRVVPFFEWIPISCDDKMQFIREFELKYPHVFSVAPLLQIRRIHNSTRNEEEKFAEFLNPFHRQLRAFVMKTNFFFFISSEWHNWNLWARILCIKTYCWD